MGLTSIPARSVMGGSPARGGRWDPRASQLRVSAAARADYAEAAAAVLSTEGHAGAVYELGGDEAFTLSSEVVVAGGDTAVVRVAVDYADREAGRWRDLWVIRLTPDGRCTSFEEWPFAPDQRDGHQAEPLPDS